MLASYLLALREGLEAALIIGIILGAVRKLQRHDLTPTVWAGVFSASIVSVAAGIGLYVIGIELEGQAEQIFEGLTMLLAAGVLTWMIFWMNQQSRNIKSDLEIGVRKSVTKTDKRGLFWLAFLAVVREGVELALFLTAATFATSAQSTIIGAMLGISTALLMGWVLFASTIRLNLKRFFQVTGVLLILFAAGLVAHGVHEFVEAGLLPAIVDPVWDLSAIIPEVSLFGSILKALFGFNAEPTLMEIVAYFGYLIAVLIGLWIVNKKPEKTEALTAQA